MARCDHERRTAPTADDRRVHHDRTPRVWGYPRWILSACPKLTKLSVRFLLTKPLPSIIFNHMVKYSSRALNATFTALSDPTRRAILSRLARGASSVTELARPFEMSLPAVSKHVRVLEHAGLLRRTRRGRVHQLHLVARPMKGAQNWLERYRRFWERQFDALADYLEHSGKGGKV